MREQVEWDTVRSSLLLCSAFGFSWGPIPWLYPPEIMPLAVRVKGVSLSTATNWAFNWVVGEATPILQEKIRWRLYPMHGFFCCCSFILVYFFFPETKGIALEDMVRISVCSMGSLLIREVQDEIFKDAGSQEDVEERAPLRNGHSVERSLTEPPRLTDADYANSPSVVQKVFGGHKSRSISSTAQSADAARASSRERNYRSTDQ